MQKRRSLLPTRRLFFRGAAALVAALFIAGCDLPFGMEGGSGSPADPDAKDVLEVSPGLELRLFAPDEVAAGDSFAVRLQVENTGRMSVPIRAPSSCFARSGVFYADGPRGGECAEMKGSLIGCAAVVTHRRVPPRETTSHRHDMQAVVTEAEETAGEEEAPAPPGQYIARVQIDWRIRERTVEGTLEAPFTVVEEK